MTTTTPDSQRGALTSPERSRPYRPRAFAVLRIVFGIVWCMDAAYKWVPAFRTQTLVAQFQHHLTEVQTPVFHQWINLWYHVAKDHTTLMGYLVAVIETTLAFCILTGFCSKLVFIAGAIFSAGIWTAAEGAGLPVVAGQTDIGTSIIYVLVYVALFIGAAGTSWSLDARFRDRSWAPSRLMD